MPVLVNGIDIATLIDNGSYSKTITIDGISGLPSGTLSNAKDVKRPDKFGITLKDGTDLSQKYMIPCLILKGDPGWNPFIIEPSQKNLVKRIEVLCVGGGQGGSGWGVGSEGERKSLSIDVDNTKNNTFTFDTGRGGERKFGSLYHRNVYVPNVWTVERGRPGGNTTFIYNETAVVIAKGGALNNSTSVSGDTYGKGGIEYKIRNEQDIYGGWYPADLITNSSDGEGGCVYLYFFDKDNKPIKPILGVKYNGVFSKSESTIQNKAII